jgi:hypothetical protein
MRETVRYIGTHQLDIKIDACIICGKSRRACDDAPKCTGKPPPARPDLFVDDDDDDLSR